MSILPLQSGRVRVVFNRDEQRTRPMAQLPALRTFGSRSAILPTDPASGGTWLAVNDAGLVLAVLNGNPPAPVRIANRRSRGLIIPQLLACDTPASALLTFENTVERRSLPPFRLVMVGHGIVADVSWNGEAVMVMSRLLGSTPMMFTSSGLGDHLVEGVRRELFDSMLSVPLAEPARSQDEFHAHSWPGREHLSVLMSRASARTVSVSCIEVTERVATFDYSDVESRTATQRLELKPITGEGEVCSRLNSL